MRRIFICFIVLLFFIGCSQQLSSEEVKQRVIDANTDMKTYRTELIMNMSGIVSAGGESQDMYYAIDSESKVDREQKKLASTGRIQTKMMEMDIGSDIETYMDGDTMYVKMMGTWISKDMNASMWDNQDNVDEYVALVDEGDLENVKEEKMAGQQYYVLELNPEKEQIMKLLEGSNMGGQRTLEDLEGLSDYSVKLWINKESFIIERSVTRITFSVSDYRGDVEMDSVIDLKISDVNEPLDIVIPEEAKNSDTPGGFMGNPDRYLPDRCTIAGGFSCMEFKVDGTTNEILLKFQNNLGRDISQASVTLTGKRENSACPGQDTKDFGNTANGEYLGSGLLRFECDDLIGDKYEGDIEIDYIISGQTVSHTSTGSIVASVE